MLKRLRELFVHSALRVPRPELSTPLCGQQALQYSPACLINALGGLSAEQSPAVVPQLLTWSKGAASVFVCLFSDVDFLWPLSPRSWRLSELTGANRTERGFGGLSPALCFCCATACVQASDWREDPPPITVSAAVPRRVSLGKRSFARSVRIYPAV